MEIKLLDSVTKATLDNEIHRLCDLYNKGHIKQVLNQSTELLERFPDSIALHIINGDCNTKLKRFDTAIINYKRAIELHPNFAVSYFNLGIALQDKGDSRAALKSYRIAIKINPNYLEAHYNIGSVLHKMGDLNAAIESYKTSLKIDPNYSRACNNLGNALKDKGNYESAIVCLETAIKLSPNYAEAFLNMGVCMKTIGKFEKSLIAFDNALKYNPDLFEAKCERLYIKREICDWSEFDQLEAELKDLGITTPAVKPFSFLFQEDHPERQLIRASNCISKNHNEEPIPLPARPKSKSNKIRIGYFSADFQEHPVANQIAQVLALHNKEKFEVYAYSFRKATDDIRKRIMHAVDHFKDVSDMSDRDVALLARKDNIDIAIDLMGYTQGSRTNIFAFRAAPVQIHMWGTTMGAKFIDYVIADSTVILDRLRKFCQEKVIYLPHSFMPTDNTRKISTKPMARKEMGLPEDGFVFCCFNANYKITPREFAIWMRLLHKVEGSVLWLRTNNEWIRNNLQKEAKLRRIDPSRLIYSEWSSQEDHLARHKLADLFLDTFSFNAHSTATDSLWAGLPIITKKGEQFVARCAASFLNAVGLPELIVKTDHEYEALAFELATNKSLLTSIKEKLLNNRTTTPLFDTQRYTCNLENVFQKAYALYHNGSFLEDIVIQGNKKVKLR